MAQLDAVKPQTDYCLTGIPFDIGDFAQDLNATTYHSPLERKLLSYSRYNRLAYSTLLRIDRVLQFHRDDSAGRDRVLGVQTPLESKEIEIAEKDDATNQTMGGHSYLFCRTNVTREIGSRGSLDIDLDAVDPWGVLVSSVRNSQPTREPSTSVSRTANPSRIGLIASANAVNEMVRRFDQPEVG